jgi:hypothetical protein
MLGISTDEIRNKYWVKSEHRYVIKKKINSGNITKNQH